MLWGRGRVSLPLALTRRFYPLNPGETHRFIGPAGVEFVTTVGVAFDAAYVQKMVDSGEWTPVIVEKPKAAPKSAGRTRKAA
jgi:hypothetical protein